MKKAIGTFVLVLVAFLWTVNSASAANRCVNAADQPVMECPIAPPNVYQLASPIPSPSREYEDITSMVFMNAWQKQPDQTSMPAMRATYGAAQQAVTKYVQRNPNFRSRYAQPVRVRARNQWRRQR